MQAHSALNNSKFQLMPIIKSAVKKLRQGQKHAEKNRVVKREMKEALDDFKKSPSSKLYSKIASLLDKASKTNLIHKNKSSRLKSRLSKYLKK
jgi:small subunit ribosomal protein S20